MNWLLLSASILAAVTALIHVLLGGREVAAPLLRTELAETVKLTMYACWHLVSAALAVSAVGLLSAASNGGQSGDLAVFVGTLWTLFGLVFLYLSLVLARPRGLFQYPQWTLLLPVGLLALLGSP